MRYLVTATMAASVLAIGLKVAPAQSLPLGGEAAAGADTAILKVQREGKGGGGGPGAGGGAGQGGPAAREPGGGGGGAMRGGGGSREGGGMREGGGQLRSGERGTRSEGSAQFRSERGTRENGGARLRAERGTRGERGVEFGYRDRDRRHGRRDGGVFIERGYGYAPAGGCGWLRQRALATDSSYWWRRYRACRGL